MFEPKKEIYDTLKALGYYVSQTAQATFPEVPAITFRIDGNAVSADLSNEIARQDITATVDIWTDSSTDGTRILSEVEAALRQNLGYQMSYSADIPQPTGALFHVQARFDTVR